MNQTFTLPDTRPYPQNPIKNHLLLNAYQLAHNSSQASRKLSSGQLQTEIRGMLEQNHYINLSLALTMSPDAGTYAALLSSVNAVLDCEKEGEVQWFALPVVLVSGCKKERAIEMKLPTEALFACLQNYPHLRALTQETQWLPYLVHSSDLSAVAPDEWWRAKQNTEAAAQHLRRFAPRPLLLPEGQSVHVVYVLGFGSGKVQAALGQNLLQAGLPLMQVWQEILHRKALRCLPIRFPPIPRRARFQTAATRANVWRWMFLRQTRYAPSGCRVRASAWSLRQRRADRFYSDLMRPTARLKSCRRCFAGSFPLPITLPSSSRISST
ncbi:Uncharacterised protein [Neisseria gonorrhoeae]|uniref:Uncharacterized protein n=1 Tax=Neisseria gonorrhoeae TaxID=485 RepID=A0A378W0G6_NEIGO|nr:Uncharacterised protein [Neisseria gonorrhoeae]